MDRVDATAHGGDDASPGRSGRHLGERERRLEERERQADERERQADEREREADKREERLAERGTQLRQHAAELRARGRSVREQASQAVEEANTVLEASLDHMRRTEAALDRAYASAAREQANIARAVMRGQQHPAPQQRDLTDLANRVSALRKRTAAAAARLAETEELVAHVHDELAAREPGNPEYKRRANEAREAMRRARETERKYSGS